LSNGNNDPPAPGHEPPIPESGVFEHPGPELPGSDPGEPRVGLAWERRAELGPGPAVLRTIGEVLFSPGKAFARMKRGGGWAEPLGFAVLVGSISIWVAQLWDMLTRSALVGMSGVSVDEVAAANAQEIWFALMAPLLICVATFFGAAIVHVLLLAFGGAPQPYETTFRVFCYTWSAGVFNAVPICGVFVAAVWRVVVQVIGIRAAQEVPIGRAAAAVIIPVLLACLCLCLAAIIAVGTGNLATLGM
jgi:hypothetical protein